MPKHLKNDYYPGVRITDYDDLDKYSLDDIIASAKSFKEINNTYKEIER